MADPCMEMMGMVAAVYTMAQLGIVECMMVIVLVEDMGADTTPMKNDILNEIMFFSKFICFSY